MRSDNRAARSGASRVAAGLLGLLCLAAAPVAARADGEAAGLPALAALEAEGAAVSGLVVDLERGRLLAAHAPDRPLAPASVAKLATASLALSTFGPSHRFATTLLRRGPLEDGVLAGDLVLRGGGDPTLAADDLWWMARQLAARGLRRVAGDLVVDEGLFGRLPCGVADRCEAATASENAYDAPLSATPVDYNALALQVLAGARAGEAARLLPEPLALPGLALDGSVETAPGPARLAAVRSSEAAGPRLTVAGRLPPGESLTLYRSVGDPPRHAGALFRAFLAEAGIAVEGATRVAYRPVENAELLLLREGEPLGTAVDLMLTWSNNLIADVLTLDLQRALAPEAAPDLVSAAALLARDLQGAAAASAFAGPAEVPLPLLRDGSGLDPESRLTARHLVVLLEREYRRTASFPALVGALLVPANGPQRSLPAPPGSEGADDWDRRLMVKTGGLSEPVSVTSLAGYFRFRDGGWGAFAFLVNGAPGRPIARTDAFSAMRRDLSTLWLR